MPKKVKAGELASEISKIMQEYADGVGEGVKDTAKKVAKEGKLKLQSTSPEGRGSRKGHYKDGWTVKTISENSTNINIALHNSKKPGLTHLLENGHAKRGGGRRVAGITHIAPVEDFIIDEFEKRLKERISK